MLPSEPSRVFISYARKDGATLAQRLQKDLKEKDFDAWLDTQRIEVGATWTTKIEVALDEAEFVLALMTSGSYVSEICRAEQLRALRKGKRVIPLLAQRGADIPLHLEAENYRDFAQVGDYATAFDQLLGDIHSGASVQLKQVFRQTYVTAPPLPVNYVKRPDEFKALRDALITDDGGHHIALTALKGMGGIGKTVLAQSLCHDEVVQQAFPDGVIWIAVGKEAVFDPLTRMREVGKALGDDLSRYDNELGARNQYRSTIRSKAALIVVDDVWRASDLEPLRAESSPRSRLLFTTRDANIAAAVGAREHVVNLLTEPQSREVLARWSDIDEAKLPVIAGELIRECGRLYLALSMVGAMLRGKPAAFWKRVLELLRNADLEKIKAQFPDYPYSSVLGAIQVSVDALDAASRERYVALAVLPEEMAAAPQVQQCIWGVEESEAAETAEQFIGLSLAQRDQAEGSIRLHDLQLDYVRAQYPNKEALELIRGAIRLSSNVIANDPEQFSSQLVGRLLPYQDMPKIEEFKRRVLEGTRTYWLRPIQPTLHPPGIGLLRTLTGHTSRVNAVAVTPDGQRAISASNDNTLKVWELDSGRELRTLTGHTDTVGAVAVTPDGQRVVSASQDKSQKVWQLDRGRELFTLSRHVHWVSAVAVTPDGQWAVSASNDNTLKVWELDGGRVLRTLMGHTNWVKAVAVTPNGRCAVSASYDNTLKVWQLDSGRELRTLSGHTDSVNAVAITPDGQRAISASNDSTLKVWELDSGRELRTLTGHASYVNAVAITPDGQRAISASNDSTLKVWELDSGRELRTLTGHASYVNAVAITPDGQHAVSASYDNTLKVWDLAIGRDLRISNGHSGPVKAVAVTPGGQRAVSASNDSTLKVWELDGGRELLILTGHKGRVNAVAVTADGQHAVSASNDETLKVWELESGGYLRTLTGHTDWVRGVAVTPDGQRAVSASDDMTLKVWELASGRHLRTLSGHTSWVTAVSIMPDGQHVVSASYDNTLKVWDLATGRELRTLSGHSNGVNAVVVTPDGRRAVSASSDRTLKVWDLKCDCEVRTLGGHAAPVLGVGVTPDGRRALSASRDNTVKLWNLDTGEVIATFTCDGEALCAAFSEALGLIVAGDAGGQLHLLHLEQPKPKK